MTDKQKMLNLIERLEYFNNWRRGADTIMPDVNQLSRDIDSSVSVIKGFIRLMDD